MQLFVCKDLSPKSSMCVERDVELRSLAKCCSNAEDRYYFISRPKTSRGLRERTGAAWHAGSLQPPFPVAARRSAKTAECRHVIDIPSSRPPTTNDRPATSAPRRAAASPLCSQGHRPDPPGLTLDRRRQIRSRRRPVDVATIELALRRHSTTYAYASATE